MMLSGRGRGRRGEDGVAPGPAGGEAAVAAMIRVLLGREPDPTADAAVLALGSAGLVQEAVAQVVAGEEYRLRQAPSPPGRGRPAGLDESLVVGAHRVLLRRDPEEEERQAWVDRLQSGLGIEEMLAALLATEEFLVRYEELRRRARLDSHDRERMAMTRRLAVLEDRVEALIRAEEVRREQRGGLGVPDRPGR